ncbi:MAG: hypothetical protein IPO72_20205 [Saprospiraceae bacterium]|nr:hypothetical protein [Candidatus Vicinibacter affinis]
MYSIYKDRKGAMWFGTSVLELVVLMDKQ